MKSVFGSCQRIKVPWLNIQTRNEMTFKESKNGDIPEETGNCRSKIKMKIVKVNKVVIFHEVNKYVLSY